jgi:hypothetical protein
MTEKLAECVGEGMLLTKSVIFYYYDICDK